MLERVPKFMETVHESESQFSSRSATTRRSAASRKSSTRLILSDLKLTKLRDLNDLIKDGPLRLRGVGAAQYVDGGGDPRHSLIPSRRSVLDGLSNSHHYCIVFR